MTPRIDIEPQHALVDNGMVATLFRPPGSGPHPAVIVVSGSSGDLWEGHAALLASRGFVTLALAYFAIESLPPRLAEIPHLPVGEVSLIACMLEQRIHTQGGHHAQ